MQGSGGGWGTSALQLAQSPCCCCRHQDPVLLTWGLTMPVVCPCSRLWDLRSGWCSSGREKLCHPPGRKGSSQAALHQHLPFSDPCTCRPDDGPKAVAGNKRTKETCGDIRQGSSSRQSLDAGVATRTEPSPAGSEWSAGKGAGDGRLQGSRNTSWSSREVAWLPHAALNPGGQSCSALPQPKAVCIQKKRPLSFRSQLNTTQITVLLDAHTHTPTAAANCSWNPLPELQPLFDPPPPPAQN